MHLMLSRVAIVGLKRGQRRTPLGADRANCNYLCTGRTAADQRFAAGHS